MKDRVLGSDEVPKPLRNSSKTLNIFWGSLKGYDLCRWPAH